jgi:ribosomal protein L16 Arg81 hydroxylase
VTSIAWDIPREKFFADYFEQHPLLARGAITTPLLEPLDVERLLYASEPTDITIRLFASGLLPITDYTDSYPDVGGEALRFNPEKLRALLTGGATLILDRVDRRIASLGRLCSEIADFTQQMAVANAYVAYGGEGAFGKHWDTHDVFVVHLAGEKQWRIFEPTHVLPLPGQTSRDRKSDCPTDSVLDVTLKVGDLLYIPRGWWHEACPVEGNFTAHIAIGLHTPKIMDYIMWTCSKSLSQLPAARKTLLASFSMGSELRMAVTAIEEAISDENNIKEFLRGSGPIGSLLDETFLPFQR